MISEYYAQKSRHKRENKASLVKKAQIEEKRNDINSKKKYIAFGTKALGCLDNN